jgi:hypothetical protein
MAIIAAKKQIVTHEPRLPAADHTSRIRLHTLVITSIIAARLENAEVTAL